MPDHNEQRVYVVPVGERVSALEIRTGNLEDKVDELIKKIDELLEIKHKGMGAIGLVSVLIVAASGLVGVITFVLSLLNHHGN